MYNIEKEREIIINFNTAFGFADDADARRGGEEEEERENEY